MHLEVTAEMLLSQLKYTINDSIPSGIDDGFESPRFATLNVLTRKDIFIHLKEVGRIVLKDLIRHLKDIKSYTEPEVESTLQYMTNKKEIFISSVEESKDPIVTLELHQILKKEPGVRSVIKTTNAPPPIKPLKRGFRL